MKMIASLSKVGGILFLFYSTLFAHGPDTLWTRTYGGMLYDQGYSVQQTTDNGYIIAGQTNSFGAGNYDVYLIKTDVNGDTLWTKTYGGTSIDLGYSVQQTTDDGYIIAGSTTSFGAGIRDVYLIKTDALGDTLWTRTYGGTGSEYGNSVQQTTDNGYIIVGNTRSFGAGSYDVWLLKTDANGDTLWTRTYGGALYDYGWSVQQTTDDGYIIAGYTRSFGETEDVYLIKTDANGDTLWTKTYGGTGSDYGYSVQQTTDNGYIIAGQTDSFGAGYDDVYLIKTDANGDTLWTRVYGGTLFDKSHSVQQTIDNGYIIAGHTRSFGAVDYNVWLLKTDANGDTLWTKIYGGTDVDKCRSVQQTTDNGYIIAGWTYSFGAGGADVWLLRIAGASFSVTPTNMDFGNVPVDSSKTDSVMVTNTGFATLDITSVVSDNAEFTVTPNIGSLAPASSMKFYISFAPTNPGTITGNITFTHNALTAPDTVAVTGTGMTSITEIGAGCITVFGFAPNMSTMTKGNVQIAYAITVPGHVSLKVYDAMGRLERTLVNTHQSAGEKTLVWDNCRVFNGVYFLKLEAENKTAIHKLILVR